MKSFLFLLPCVFFTAADASSYASSSGITKLSLSEQNPTNGEYFAYTTRVYNVVLNGEFTIDRVEEAGSDVYYYGQFIDAPADGLATSCPGTIQLKRSDYGRGDYKMEVKWKVDRDARCDRAGKTYSLVLNEAIPVENRDGYFRNLHTDFRSPHVIKGWPEWYITGEGLDCYERPSFSSNLVTSLPGGQTVSYDNNRHPNFTTDNNNVPWIFLELPRAACWVAPNSRYLVPMTLPY